MDVIGGAGISKQSWVVLVGKAELASLAAKAVGNDMNKEYILYCDTGKTATSWAFAMTEMLGYKNALSKSLSVNNRYGGIIRSLIFINAIILVGC